MSWATSVRSALSWAAIAGLIGGCGTNSGIDSADSVGNGDLAADVDALSLEQRTAFSDLVVRGRVVGVSYDRWNSRDGTQWSPTQASRDAGIDPAILRTLSIKVTEVWHAFAETHVETNEIVEAEFLVEIPGVVSRKDEGNRLPRFGEDAVFFLAEGLTTLGPDPQFVPSITPVGGAAATFVVSDGTLQSRAGRSSYYLEDARSRVQLARLAVDLPAGPYADAIFSVAGSLGTIERATQLANAVGSATILNVGELTWNSDDGSPWSGNNLVTGVVVEPKQLVQVDLSFDDLWAVAGNQELEANQIYSVLFPIVDGKPDWLAKGTKLIIALQRGEQTFPSGRHRSALAPVADPAALWVLDAELTARNPESARVATPTDLRTSVENAFDEPSPSSVPHGPGFVDVSSLPVLASFEGDKPPLVLHGGFDGKFLTVGVVGTGTVEASGSQTRFSTTYPASDVIGTPVVLRGLITAVEGSRTVYLIIAAAQTRVAVDSGAVEMFPIEGSAAAAGVVAVSTLETLTITTQGQELIHTERLEPIEA